MPTAREKEQSSAAAETLSAAATAAPDVPEVPPGPDPSPEGGEPAVLSPRGSRVVRLDDWTTEEFRVVLGEGEGARAVVLTAEGLRVTQAQAQELQEAAAAHGVVVTVDEVTD